MSDANLAYSALTKRYLQLHPGEAALALAEAEPDTALDLLLAQPLDAQRRLWEQMPPDAADELLRRLPDETASTLIPVLDPGQCAAALARLPAGDRERLLRVVDSTLGEEFERLMTYPADSAGKLMDLRPAAFAGSMTAGEALKRLRKRRRRVLRSVFTLKTGGELEGTVDIQDLALADADTTLVELARPLKATVTALDPRAHIGQLLEDTRIEELPVVDVNGRLLGVIHAASLIQAVADDARADLQTMVGVGKDERALSPVGFAVKRRIVWMHINLATAFLAASVVGLFESTIAQFTALAVLLPVVAGQSGNAGAQALAVTMRGLALREVSLRQWLLLVFKESRVGAINGVAVALTTSLGVFLWSQSTGLAMIIGVSMVMSMTLACVAGALVPIVLTRMGQDPATSSSIILTTVTDVGGFFSFLGIATLFSGLLVAG